MSLFADLSAHMGELLGPRPVAEIVITQYEDDKVNYQIEGMRGPVPPQQAYHLLSIVAQQLIVQVPAPIPTVEETPTV